MPEATGSREDVRRNQRQCPEDTDLDGADRGADLEVFATQIQIQLVVVHLVALLRQQLFVYRDLYKWLDDPFQAPPVLTGVHDGQLQLEF
jgi:hypothetical protein